ncbi:hypothetical protein EVAR_54580_1 [Eumeta japonica]|uniref:Uncharacterized protein n=1 Tax=Eumeta variegata TaxID=151549 RepID=A0A4C1YIJ4_EUMVA|nr:hypothetical protein EVAR_54580_1 [Eumeta japonica]
MFFFITANKDSKNSFSLGKLRYPRAIQSKLYFGTPSVSKSSSKSETVAGCISVAYRTKNGIESRARHQKEKQFRDRVFICSRARVRVALVVASTASAAAARHLCLGALGVRSPDGVPEGRIPLFEAEGGHTYVARLGPPRLQNNSRTKAQRRGRDTRDPDPGVMTPGSCLGAGKAPRLLNTASATPSGHWSSYLNVEVKNLSSRSQKYIGFVLMKNFEKIS